MGRTIGIGLIAVLACTLTSAPVRGGDDAAEFFESKVRPLLATHCISCHGPAKHKAGLRLDTAEGVKKGGESGPLLTPGKPEASRLVDAVKYHDDTLQMPPKGKLASPDIDAISRWVKDGAVWPEIKASARVAVDTGKKVSAEDRAFWSFRPVKAVEAPKVKDAEWSKSPIDRFLFVALEAKGLTPSPRADKRALIRRLTFDLTGLPPRRSRRSSKTSRPRLMRRSSTACWFHPATASAGRGTGSTWPATARTRPTPSRPAFSRRATSIATGL
jgi:hypothetical protein